MPELVLPAGDLEKLKTAVLFGADAVYLGGKQFSLRAFAGNFSRDEMKQGLDFAHNRGKKVSVTVNILAHNDELRTMPAYLEDLEQLGIDALIISDPGVMKLAQQYAPAIPITVSTQANVTNYAAASFYQEMGAKRIVLAREVTLDEMQQIKERVNVELEVFIHGAMCVSYSGRCLLSHYMSGRSANRGECAHPCRYRYAVMEEKRPGQFFPLEEDEHGSYIFNSRDLCLLEYIPRLMEIGIDAFKVEGRMKSPLYAASTVSVYRQAIDAYAENPQPFNEIQLAGWMEELYKTATRPFTNGFIEGESPEIQDINKEDKGGRADFCGVIMSYHPNRKMAEVEQRNNFGPGDNLEFLIPGGQVQKVDLTNLFDEEGNEIDRARHPLQRVFMPLEKPVPVYSILRRV
ncbi:MAG TPA: U32 family peptidase [Syntrophomonadaceae bacterium]|nr:U32 family peptidase [Syntrophomonadaceae bacterium]